MEIDLRNHSFAPGSPPGQIAGEQRTDPVGGRRHEEVRECVCRECEELALGRAKRKSNKNLSGNELFNITSKEHAV